jgi:hypothetical protein
MRPSTISRTYGVNCVVLRSQLNRKIRFNGIKIYRGKIDDCWSKAEIPFLSGEKFWLRQDLQDLQDIFVVLFLSCLSPKRRFSFTSRRPAHRGLPSGLEAYGLEAAPVGRN